MRKNNYDWFDMISAMSVINLSLTTVQQQLPDFIHQKLARYSAQSNSYHHQPDELRELIAKKHSVGIDTISLTAGVDQAILLLSTLYGQNGHIFTPTYISYNDIKRVGGVLTEHFSLYDSGYVISSETITDASLIFIANPNNPAGITSRDTILELVKNNPNAKVVVDEAYGDFAGESVVQDVAHHGNLIVLSSFSKGYALAGFRIGYMVARPKLIEEMSLESTWFNVAYTSVGAAVAALEHEDYFAEIRATIIAEREKFERYLAGAGFNVLPSSINAVLVRFADKADAADFARALEEREILVSQGSGGSNIGLEDRFIRITIGTPEQMQLVVKAIDSL
jgi:histidinol-phosphate aminotransferase